MNAALRKEIRLLLPAWIVAMAAAILPMWIMSVWLLQNNPELMEGTFFALFAAGALLLSVSSFGSEMSLGTFPSLLAQPRPRLATWRMKIGLLALALAGVTLAASFSWWLRIYELIKMRVEDADFYAWPSVFGPRPYHILYLLLPIAVIAFASGLWTTLLFRQTLTSFWISIIAPLVLFWPWIERQSSNSFTQASCLYGLVGYFLARRLFLNAQDTQTNSAAAAAKWTLLPAFRKSRSPAAALFSKELRLQQATLLFASVMVLADLVRLAARKYYGPSDTIDASVGFSILGWGCVPFLVGCVSIAEERQSHTLEGALCLPVGRRTQFLIKLAIMFGLGIFLGAVLPWSLRHFWDERLGELDTVSTLKLNMVVAAIFTAIGCYASSLSRTMLQAFGVAIAIVIMWAFAGRRLVERLVFALYHLCMLVGEPKHGVSVAHSFLVRVFGALPNIPGAVLVAAVVSFAIALLAYMSYGNFKQLRIDWKKWCRICLIVSAAYAFLMILGFISMAIHHRTYLH